MTAEAHINGARVVVFSQFVPVLEVIRKALPSNVFGPLDDTVPDPQAVISEFAAHHGPATLLAQLDCGALILRKVPAPLIVILIEPQWRPQVERQIIGRSQRISELPTLRVYRLLARSSIDEPIRRLAQSRDGNNLHIRHRGWIRLPDRTAGQCRCHESELGDLTTSA